LNIATIKSESDWNKFKVHTLLQNPTQKQPSINAYLGARYSRSCDSITDIASEIMESGTDAAEKLEKIFSGYGGTFSLFGKYTYVYSHENILHVFRSLRTGEINEVPEF